jgi:uncharacterized protein YcaQ
VSEPERTEDGRYIIVDGRKWRATDPLIPEERAAELRKELMAARRKQDRAAVQAAKVKLGERGTPWWEQSEEERRARWSAQ